MKAKRLALLVLIFIFSSSILANATVYQEITKVPLAEGVNYVTIKNFESYGWDKVYIIEADMTTPNLAFDVAVDPRGIGYLNTVEKYAQMHDAVAAVNGDFFSWYKGSQGAPTGTVIKDGKMLTSPPPDMVLSTFYLGIDEKFTADYLTYSSTLTSPSGAYSVVSYVNKFHPDDAIILYTPDFLEGGLSPGSQNGYIELVVKDGIVTKKLIDSPPVKIEEDELLFRANLSKNSFLNDYFQVGEAAEFKVSLNFNMENIKTAVGGGTILVKEGKKHPITHNVSGIHPRTVIGTDESGKMLYLITVDGRGTFTPGYSLDSLANLLIGLGIYTAINLDGGGSTTMVLQDAKTDSKIVANNPSQSSLRAVSNAIIVKNTSPEQKPYKIILESESKYSFAGFGNNIYAFLADQKNHLIKDAKISLYVKEGKGEIKNGVFYPKSPGKAVIGAKYEDLESEIEITVLEKIARISVYPEEGLKIKAGQSAPLTIIGRDQNGYESYLHADDLNVKYDDSIIDLDKNIITVKKESPTLIEISYGKLKTYQVINNTGVKEEYYNGIEDSSLKFWGYPDQVLGSFELDSTDCEGDFAGKLNFDFSTPSDALYAAHIVFPDGFDIGNSSKISVKVYSETTFPHAIKAQINDKDGNVHRITLAKSIDFTGWKTLSAEIPKDILRPLTLSKLYVVQNNVEDRQSGYVKFDSFMAYESLSQNGKTAIERPEDVYEPDPLEEVSLGTKLAITPGKPSNKTLFTNLLYKISTDFAKDNAQKYIEIGQTGPYYNEKINDTEIICLDNSKQKSIRITDKNTWGLFLDKLKNIKSGNVIITLTDSVDFSDPEEYELFISQIEKNLSGKTVYVVYPGDKDEVNIKNGVRFIKIHNANYTVREYLKSGPKMLFFDLSKDKITYEFKAVN